MHMDLVWTIGNEIVGIVHVVIDHHDAPSILNIESPNTIGYSKHSILIQFIVLIYYNSLPLIVH